MTFVIENEEGIKEVFSYERPLIDHSIHAIEEYARATYGTSAIFRRLTEAEQACFHLHGEKCLIENHHCNLS